MKTIEFLLNIFQIFKLFSKLGLMLDLYAKV